MTYWEIHYSHVCIHLTIREIPSLVQFHSEFQSFVCIWQSDLLYDFWLFTERLCSSLVVGLHRFLEFVTPYCVWKTFLFTYVWCTIWERKKKRAVGILQWCGFFVKIKRTESDANVFSLHCIHYIMLTVRAVALVRWPWRWIVTSSVQSSFF